MSELIRTGNSINNENPRDLRVEKMQNTKKVGRIDAQNDFNVSVDMPGRRDHPAENHCDTCVPRKVLACHESTLLISVS